jgi:hypothetical protein
MLDKNYAPCNEIASIFFDASLFFWYSHGQQIETMTAFGENISVSSSSQAHHGMLREA